MTPKDKYIKLCTIFADLQLMDFEGEQVYEKLEDVMQDLWNELTEAEIKEVRSAIERSAQALAEKAKLRIYVS